MRLLLVTVQVPFTRGGAEVLAEELLAALREAGHQAEIVAIPFKWYPPERLLDQVLACRLLDLTEAGGLAIDRAIGLKFPAYYVKHPNKVLWMLHQHRSAYDLWDHPLGDLIRFPDGAQTRDAIRELDRRLIPEAAAVYTISRNVSRRLEEHCGIASSPLYHPPRHAELFTCEGDEGYLFFPSRIHETKRQELVIEALAAAQGKARVRFAGRPDLPSFEEKLKARASKLGVADRVTFCGGVSGEELIRLYAHCRAVVYPPLDEDYGYVTLEAMLSGKPVITCRDSGGSLEFVAPGETGLVAEPVPEALGAALEDLIADPERCRRLGRAGRDRYESLGIAWSHVVERLLA